VSAQNTKTQLSGKTDGAYVALRVLLAYVCLSHVILGGLGFLFPPDPIALRIIKATYGATVVLTPQLIHVIRMLGAFMIAIGFLAGLAFTNPFRNRAIIWGIILLLILRVSQRFIFAAEIQEAFGVTSGRLVLQAVFFLAIALGLLLLLPKEPVSTNFQTPQSRV
jgi:hypothetical protein